MKKSAGRTFRIKNAQTEMKIHENKNLIRKKYETKGTLALTDRASEGEIPKEGPSKEDGAMETGK